MTSHKAVADDNVRISCSTMTGRDACPPVYDPRTTRLDKDRTLGTDCNGCDPKSFRTSCGRMDRGLLGEEEPSEPFGKATVKKKPFSGELLLPVRGDRPLEHAVALPPGPPGAYCSVTSGRDGTW